MKRVAIATPSPAEAPVTMAIGRVDEGVKFKFLRDWEAAEWTIQSGRRLSH
jgi:hypothetical protein